MPVSNLRLLSTALLSALLLPAAHAQPATQPLTVAAIFNDPTLTAEPPGGLEWTPDGTQLTYFSERGDLIAADPQTGQTSVLVPREKMGGMHTGSATEQDKDHRSRYNQASYIWAPDSKHLLFDSNGALFLYALKDGVGVAVAQTEGSSGEDPKFAPDGSAVSYISGHDLYLRRLPYTQPSLRLSSSHDDAVLNGEVDWLYLEELDVRSNYFWSPDSRQIAFLQMNESAVPHYPITDWIPTHAAVNPQRYPQPGDANPAVRVGVVNVSSGHVNWMKVPLDMGNDYIPRFGWINHRVLWVETLSRDQQHRRLYFVDAATGASRLALEEKDDKFLDVAYDIEFSGENILLTSWRDGHNQIYLYHYDQANPMGSEAKLVRQVTTGTGDVSSIKSVDAAHGLVFYLSNEGESRDQQLWMVKLDGSSKLQITQGSGTHKPELAPNSTTYVDLFSNASTPPSLSMCHAAARQCKLLWQSTPNPQYTLRNPLQFTVKGKDGTPLNATLMLPPGKTAASSVPLINNPYGGPHAQNVPNEWQSRTRLFDQVLADHGFAVLHVENRGMAGHGRDFEQAAYRDFGPAQLEDQLSALDQVLAMHPELDAKRQGWWGWSWGGTFTLYAMTHSDRFRAGVAVAPVTDWRNYDSAYTERYLGLPARNEQQYRDFSVNNAADELKGRLLLVHGTGDDNVHMENTVQFVQKLIDAELPYDLQLYPRKTHSIAGADARTHLYTRILAQFEAYLGQAQ